MSGAFRRFRPYLTLEPSRETVNMVNGVPATWDFVRGARPDFLWTERSLPPSFRGELAACPGLERYAVSGVEDLPVSLRSAHWKELLVLRASFAELVPLRQNALVKLLGMLGFYEDAAALLSVLPPPPERGAWDEVQSQRAFLSMTGRCMLAEDALRRDYSEMAAIAERSTPGTPIRFYAAIKHMVYCLENGVYDRSVAECDVLAGEEVRRARGRVPAFEAEALASKWWRARAYLPFMSRDAAGARRNLLRAREHALACLDAAPAGARDFAEENLYAVGQTLGVSELRNGAPREARRHLREMIRRDPGGAWQRHWHGMALAALGRLDEARDELLRAHRLAPPLKDKIAAELAKVCARLGRAAEAARWRREAERVGGAVGRHRPEKAPEAAAPAAAGDFRRAEELLRRDGAAAAWRALAAALARRDDGAAAYRALGPGPEADALLSRLDRELKRRPAAPEALAWRGLLRWRTGDYPGAIFDLSRTPRAAAAPVSLALADCEVRSRNQACLPRLAAVLKRRPGHAGALALAREAFRVFGLEPGRTA